MDTLLRDLRHAVRSLARQRGFTLAALATLALGIGANVAMFSIVYGLVLRPLPYPDADAIVRVGQVPTGLPRSTLALNNYSMQLLQEEAESFEHLAAYTPLQAEWAVREGSVRLRGTAVSPALFPLLRARPHLGRLFTEDEVREGADQVVLLSYDTWATRFGSDPEVVGTVLEIGGVARAVVGVLAEGFYFPSPEDEMWTPLVLPAFEPPGFAERGRSGRSDLRLHRRLRTGATPGGRVAGAGRGRGKDPAGAPGRSAVRRLARPQRGGERPAGLRDPGDSTAGGDDRRVPAGAAGPQRGDGAGAVDRMHQRSRAPACARGVASTGAGRLRGPWSRPRPAGAAAPDRERHPGAGWRRARPGRGRSRAARGSGAGPGRRPAARRGGRRRRGARVHARALGSGRPGVRRRPGVPVVPRGPRPRPQRGKRAGGWRVPVAARQPHAGRAGRGAGGLGADAAGGGGPAAPQLRGAGDRRSRVRPRQP